MVDNEVYERMEEGKETIYAREGIVYSLTLINGKIKKQIL